MKDNITLKISLLVGLVMLVVGFLISQLTVYLLPTLTAEYSNSALFRTWSDPKMWLYFVYPFAAGLLLAWIWTKVRGRFTGKFWQRGTKFGLVAWIVTLPGMLMSYSSFPVSLNLVLSWTVSNLVQLIVAGILLAKVAKN